VFNLLDIYTLNTVIFLDGVIRLDACPFLLFCSGLCSFAMEIAKKCYLVTIGM